MAHKRDTLVAAIIAQIKAASVTGIGNKVYDNRAIQFEDSELPACVVFHETETSEIEDFAQDLKRRTLSVIVEIQQLAAGATINDPDISSDLNDLAEEVEDALEADITFGGNALWFIHTSTAMDVEDAEKLRGAMQIALEVTYRTSRTAAAS